MSPSRCACGLVLAVLLLAGCQRPTLEVRLASDDPMVRAVAVHELASVQEAEADGRLIRMLADEDEGVRFYTAAALYRRTGERLGFEPQGPLGERSAAIRRWIDWHVTTYPGTDSQFAELQEQVDAVLGDRKPAVDEQGANGSGAPREETGASPDMKDGDQ